MQKRRSATSSFLARHSLLDFARHTYSRYQVGAPHRAIAVALEAVERGTCPRLIIECPPRHGKSELASVRFPAWYLGRNPDKRVIACSYSAELSFAFSRQARNIVRSDEYRALFPDAALSPDSQAVAGWNLAAPHRGGYVSAGVGGSITGKGAHLLLIDDPVKDAEEAASDATLESIWQWYTTTAYTRLEDGGAVVVIMTRWAEHDLVGRLLEAMGADEADQWSVLRLPALAEDDDPLDRAPDAALWPEKYDEVALRTIRANIGERAFAALYQQRPMPLAGGMFPAGCFEIVDAVPAAARRVRYWDKAGTEGGGAYSAGVKVAEAGGTYYIEDVVRGQWSSDQRNGVMRQTAQLDGTAVPVWIEQEPGSGGKESAEISVKLLAGFAVHIERVTGDKETRARPFAAQAQATNVKLVRGPWNAAFVAEAATFPAGKYKDQIDAAGGGFNKLALGGQSGNYVAGGQRAIPGQRQVAPNPYPGGVATPHRIIR